MTDEELKQDYISKHGVTVGKPAFAQGYTPPDGFLAQLFACGLGNLAAYSRDPRFNAMPDTSEEKYRRRKKAERADKLKYKPIEWGEYALGHDAKTPPNIDPHLKVAPIVRGKPVMTPGGRFPSAKAAGDAFGISKGSAAEKARLKKDGWRYCV